MCNQSDIEVKKQLLSESVKILSRLEKFYSDFCQSEPYDKILSKRILTGGLSEAIKNVKILKNEITVDLVEQLNLL